jgi:hypothetical protein
MSTIDPQLIDVVLPEHDGYPDEMAAEDTPDALWEACGDASRDFPPHLWIEPRQWAEVAAENDRNRTWPLDYLDRFTNQNPTHECTCHMLRACGESSRNRQRAITVGPPVAGQQRPESAASASVWLSCLSIYAEANPRIRGGANIRTVLSIASRRGFLPDAKQPRDWGFRHSLIGTAGKGNVTQSSGAWVPLSKFPQGWEETARHFRPLEVIFPESWEQIVCLVLAGYAVGVGRSGHAIPYAKWIAADSVMAYVDSYDVIRYDSTRMIRSAVGGAFAIASFTTPDDWDKPAG